MPTSMKRVLPALAAVGLLALGAAMSWAYPKPAIVSKAWQLDFKYEAPRAIAVPDLAGVNHWYWYLTYTVTNNTGADQLFIPEVTIATDQGDIIVAGKNVPSTVYTAIKKSLGDRLLQMPIDVTGRILQGPDYALHSVAVWPVEKKNIDEMSVMIGGLSGETAAATVPDPKHPGKSESVLLSKTLMLNYELPGHPSDPQEQPVVFQSKRWVMR